MKYMMKILESVVKHRNNKKGSGTISACGFAIRMAFATCSTSTNLSWWQMKQSLILKLNIKSMNLESL